MAAIAVAAQQAAPPAPPPPPLVAPVDVVGAPTYARQETHRFDDRPPAQPYQRPHEYPYDAYREPVAKDGFMKFTQIAIVGAVIALLGFAVWRLFLQPHPVTPPDLAATAQVTGVAGQQITQISPAQLRRIIVATQAHATPDPGGPIIAQLPAGSTLDVSGQIQVNGINWLRILLPNDSSKSGFVREDQMENLGDGTLSVTPLDQLPGIVGPSTPSVTPSVAETIGPVQAREPSTFYVASVQANIRQEANVTSTKVGTFEFTDPITVVGQRMIGARIWYQIQLPSGGTGWINGRLVSTTPRDIPIDVPASPKNSGSTTPATKPPSGGGLSQTGQADNEAALTALGPGASIRVDASIANLRKEPGATGNSVIEVLPRDTLLSVEDVRIVNGVPWYRITTPNGAQGWISGRTVVGAK